MSSDPKAPTDNLAREPVTVLKGVGPRRAEALARLGLRSVQDVLFHLPSRYEDRTRIAPIASLRPGERVSVEGRVLRAELRHARRRSLLVTLSDDSGLLILRFFYFSAAQQAGLAVNTRLRCFGEVRSGPQSLEMVHPEYRRITGEAPAPMEEHLTPVYPATEGVQQPVLRDLTTQALDRMRDAGVSELLPDQVLRPLHLPPLADAIGYLHHPPPEVSLEDLAAGLHPSQRRLAYEELLAYQLGLRRRRLQQRQVSAPALDGDGQLRAALYASLPFALTGAQERVVSEIRADLVRAHPMLRLLQGDVGSGKTVVAALAALQAAEAGCQTALMAPTEILAEQHFRGLSAWLEPLGVKVGLLLGRHKGRAREAIVDGIAAGDFSLVVGTHSLFQEDVRFHRLGLAITDEQHRFGVHQRLALKEKADGLVPHQLVMTATPIPRTLAMTAYADLDVSVIDQLPPGRSPVTTAVLPDTRRDEVIERIRAACGEGRQAYWVCTLIEESEALQCQAAEDAATLLVEVLPELSVGLVHGRVKSAHKEAVMGQFKAGELDLLVATTVIEVGVDVPNASLMVIENPERLGLAQLHQLRGRVGRGTARSHCLLMYHPPLSELARERLKILRETNDGFEIARRDLELRGPGEVLGTRQTGLLELRIADLLRDQGLLPAVREAADLMLRRYPRQVEPLVDRWLGGRDRYARV